MYRLSWIAVFFLLLFGVNCQAQFEIGLNIGTTLSRSNRMDELYFKNDVCPSFVPEFKFGYTFNDHWKINSGFAYLSKGYKLEPQNEIIGESEYCHFRYLSIPIYISYFRTYNNFYGAISCGLQGDFFLSQETPTFYFNESNQKKYELDNAEMNPCLEMIFGVEVGYQLNSNWKIDFSYRYGFDFTNADDRELHGKFRTQFISAGITYILESIQKVESEYIDIH